MVQVVNGRSERVLVLVPQFAKQLLLVFVALDTLGPASRHRLQFWRVTTKLGSLRDQIESHEDRLDPAKSEHLVANLYFGVELFRHERRGLGLQFNVENANDRVFAIAKESEFTPVQFSPPRFLSGSMRIRF